MSARRVPSSRKRSAAERRQNRPQPRHLAARAGHRLRHARTEVVGVVAISVAVLLVLTGAVVAYFGGSGNDTATGTVGSLSAPTNVVAAQVPSTSNVSVTWTASTGTPVPEGYYVTRTTGVSTANACGTSPTSLVTSSTCTDTSVANGTHTYRVIAVYRSWTATSAPANVTVTVVTVVNPVITNIRPTSTLFGATWGAISCGTPASSVCANVAPGAGIVSSVSAQMKRASDGQCYDGSGTNPTGDWSIAACSVPLPMNLNGAPNYSSAALLNAAYAQNDTYTFTITATNSVGGTASGSTVRMIDTALPVATLTRYTNDGAAVSLSATDGNGITSIAYRIDANSGAFTTVTGPGPVTLQPTLSTGNHTVDYQVIDGAGRTLSVTDAPVTVETTAPSVSGLVPADDAGAGNFSGVDCNAGSLPNSQRLCATATDTGGSGVATVTYQLMRASDSHCYDGAGGDPTTDWSLAACSTGLGMALDSGTLYRTPVILTGAYSDADEYTFTVKATDNAGNSGTAASTFYMDSTAPALGSAVPANNTTWDIDAGAESGIPFWSTACGSGRVCADAFDNEIGMRSVTFTLVKDQPGTGQDRCWNGSTFVSGLSCGQQNMPLQSGVTWAGANIPTSEIAAIGGSANFKLVITATNRANVTTTTTINLTFG